MEYLKELIHGGDLTTCRERYGQREYIDFSASLNPLGQPESVRLALQNCADACMRYPDALCRELKSALSRYDGVPEEWIVCGNGASDLIYRIALGLRPKAALLPSPTFAEYEQALRLVDCDIRFHQLREDADFALTGDILEEIPESGIVFLCNPNNPTGGVVEKGLLRRIADTCAARGSTLAIDECFLEFVDFGEDYSLKSELAGRNNVILMRAFTKMYALPGVRLGYVITPDSGLSELLNRVGATWSVSVPAQLCGVAAAGEKDFAARTRERVGDWRQKLSDRLKRLGFKVYPSNANYLLFRSEVHDLAERLCERGIVIRECGNFKGLRPGFYRVAVRTEQENNRLLDEISAVLLR